MRRLLGSIGIVTGIVLLVYIGAGPWTPPRALIGAPPAVEQPAEPRRPSSQPSEIQQARIGAALWTVGLISGAIVIGFVAIIVGASLYLRRQRVAKEQ
ncbi:MAG: hypothetical protein RMM58_05430 [Chloroflexota bacterium]|nr:hypothetical protein [Dehalococcoidia bacterium]MDW8253305.1 hypothetical protein [Chloroflexota bacterium]